MRHNQTVTDTAKKNRWELLKRRRKMLLAWHQITMTQIAREMNLSPETIKTVVNLYPERTSRRVQDYIARRLKVPYERLWGFRDQHDHHKGHYNKGKKACK